MLSLLEIFQARGMNVQADGYPQTLSQTILQLMFFLFICLVSHAQSQPAERVSFVFEEDLAHQSRHFPCYPSFLELHETYTSQKQRKRIRSSDFRAEHVYETHEAIYHGHGQSCTGSNGYMEARARDVNNAWNWNWPPKAKSGSDGWLEPQCLTDSLVWGLLLQQQQHHQSLVLLLIVEAANIERPYLHVSMEVFKFVSMATISIQMLSSPKAGGRAFKCGAFGHRSWTRFTPYPRSKLPR